MRALAKAFRNILAIEGKEVRSSAEDLADAEYKTHYLRDKTFVDWLIVSSSPRFIKFSVAERIGQELFFKFSGVCSRECMESFVRLLANTLDMDLVKREDRK